MSEEDKTMNLHGLAATLTIVGVSGMAWAGWAVEQRIAWTHKGSRTAPVLVAIARPISRYMSPQSPIAFSGTLPMFALPRAVHF